MDRNILDIDEYDTEVVLDAVTVENGEDIITPLYRDEYGLENMLRYTIEPVTEHVYVLKSGESVGTIFNSEFSVAKALETEDDIVQAHLDKRVKTVVSFEEVFNSWHRYVHSWSVDTQPSWPDAVNSWTYDPELNSIITGTDAATKMHHIGMVSPNALRNYDLDIGLSLYKASGATDGDDWLGVVCGFIIDEAGRERTITALRSTGAGVQNVSDDRSKWKVNSNGIIYTSGSNEAYQVALVYDYRGTDQRILYRALNKHIGHIWFSSGGSRIRAVKQGNMLSVDWYAMTGNTNNDIVASVTVDLNDAADTRQFKDFVQIGYCAQSQAYGVFTNLVDGGNYVFETSAYGELVSTETGSVQYGWLADVNNEGVATSGSNIDTTPSREVATDIYRLAYPKDRVTVRYDRKVLTTVMVMDEASGDFDWYDSAAWDDYASAASAKDGLKAAAERQGFDTVKILYNISCTRELQNGDYYLAVKFSSFILTGDSDTDVAYFKLPE